MRSLLSNLINGNLTTARKQAKRFSQLEIRTYMEEQDFSPLKSALAAAWLKTGEGFQAYCDAD